MERRAVLASLGALVGLPGCVSDASESGPGTETEPETATETETETGTTTDDCGWPQFCEGSKLVEVTVNSGFSGEVVLEAGCRDEAFVIRPGETKTVERQVDAESCEIALYVDGREAYSGTIYDYESTTLRVDSSGEVEEETLEL